MTTATENLSTILAHHGFDVVGKSDDTLTDDARAAGLIYACTGCGTVGGILASDGEAARVRTRDNLDLDALCCEDANQIIF